MKKLYVVIGALVMLGFIGCSAKVKPVEYYDRANDAASEAQKSFK